MLHKPADLRKKMEAAVPANVDWRYKPMFGGIGVYANDRMCVSLSDVGLAVKLGNASQAQLLKLRGARRLQYEPSMPPSKTYIVVPEVMLSNPMVLGRWLAKSAIEAAVAPAREPRKAARKPGPSRGRSHRG
jgi:TfoX/Sxy family transcriptional regulator of competence genes